MATANSTPSTMRAWAFRTRGPATSVLRLESNFPTPAAPTGSKVRIKVSHASLTPSSAHLTSLIPSLPLLSRPYIPELDFAGTVELAGPDAPASLARGTRVFGSVSLPDFALRGKGSLAEYVLVPASEVAVLPNAAGFGLAEGAALNGNGQTAALMVQNAGIKKGSRVFVNGASGGVGTLAVQIARAEGAYVVATGSGESAELVKSLGADEVTDYRVQSPLDAYLGKTYSSEPFDAILDTVGVQMLYDSSPAYLKPDGPFINVGAMEGIGTTLWSGAKNMLWPQFLGGTPRKYIFQQTNPTQDRMKYLIRFVEEGKLKVIIDQVFQMEDALQAYERILSQRAKGKVVVMVQNV